MGWLIIAGLVAVPVVEIMAWIRLAELIGGWWTLIVSVAAVMAGLAILRRQGLAMLLDARARLELGETPVRAAFDGLCLAVAGVLLAVPGLVTDCVALPLLLPPVRGVLFRRFGGRMTVVGAASRPAGGDADSSRPMVIDAEYEIIDPDRPDRA
ncbi:FxsA family protein [Magnetospirillum sp. SS-4]|uniref:FxsA family protein n=1 Tax=Magnetospirillum sp. SS-4 TaxID=2681465 RepID=UPI0013821858|nr:FxsA family protein [Magnetospirillum sp. SS-4]CAA7620870.1 FxsA cytoplasmic membrane protein [Magnetospirillum sp. SS-4]